MKSTVGETLRKCRVAAGKSVREMSELLTANGFKASEKTIYSWENGNSQPTPDALLVMCRAYGVEDVLGTFGYAPEKPTTIAAHFDGNEFTPEQIEKIKEELVNATLVLEVPEKTKHGIVIDLLREIPGIEYVEEI